MHDNSEVSTSLPSVEHEWCWGISTKAIRVHVNISHRDLIAIFTKQGFRERLSNGKTMTYNHTLVYCTHCFYTFCRSLYSLLCFIRIVRDPQKDHARNVMVNTHRGLFRYNRLPYGVSSAPGVLRLSLFSYIANLLIASAQIGSRCGLLIE